MSSIPDADPWAKLARHAMSAAFGKMPPEDYAALIHDVAENGFTRPAVYVWLGEIIDGWLRHLVRLHLRLAPDVLAYTVLPDNMPRHEVMEIAMRANHEHRRGNLKPAERVRVCVEQTAWRPPRRGRPDKRASGPLSDGPGKGRPGKSEHGQVARLTIAEVAEVCRVGERTVKRVLAGLRLAAPAEPPQKAVKGREPEPRPPAAESPETAPAASTAPERPDPAPPTPEDSQAAMLARIAEERDDLQEMVTFLKSELGDTDTAAREAQFNSFRAREKTLLARNAKLAQEVSELKRSLKAASRRIRRLEGQSS